MSDKNGDLFDQLKKRINQAVDDGNTNVAKAINVGGKGRRASVSSRQRVVHRDGVTTRVTETHREETDE